MGVILSAGHRASSLLLGQVLGVPLLTDTDKILSNINPPLAKVSYLILHPHKVVCRYRDPQLHVGENYAHLFNLRPDICKS